MPSPNNVLTADSYIQDGLVFQLDGIDYGGVDGQWIDRIKKVDAFNTAAISHDDSGFYFSGNKIVSLIDGQNIGVDNFEQFEVVLNIPLERTAFIFLNPNPSFAAVARQDGAIRFGNASSASYCLRQHQIATYSANILKYIENGALLSKIANSEWNNGDRASLGGRNRLQPYYLIGTIYAIRVYSRQLTDREILINQKIDNARFGLGLDIPDEVKPANRSLSLSEPFEFPDESESEQEPTNDNSDER